MEGKNKGKDKKRKYCPKPNLVDTAGNDEQTGGIESDFMKLLAAIGERKVKGFVPEEKRYGLIGGSISHSLSKRLHSLLGGYSYSLIELRDAARLKEVLDMSGYYGFNITNPYKEVVIDYLDELSPEAAAIGAVNTVKRLDDGRLKGYNTDYLGLMKLFEPNYVKGKKVAILGTGGASLAAAYAVKMLGAGEIFRVSRGRRKAESKGVAADINCVGEALKVCIDKTGECPETFTYEDENWRDADIVINATPVGMFPDNGKSPLDVFGISWEELPYAEAAVDLIYNPYRTKFLQDAEAASRKVIGGLGMLVWQGIYARDIWEGIGTESDYSLVASVMERLLREQLNLVTVGMPGSGKSSISRQVAIALKRKFIDIDRAIAGDESCKVNKIIEQRGLAYFRQLEKDKLAEVCSKNCQVIATGGGSVLEASNRELMRENSVVVYIDRPTGLLSTKGRPLSQSQGVDKLYRDRVELYKGVSDIRIKNRFKFGAAKQYAKSDGAPIRKQSVRSEQSQYMTDIRCFARSIAKRYKLHIKNIVRDEIHGIGADLDKSNG